MYCELHFPCTFSMMHQDIKLVFNKYNAIYKLLIWNSKFENLKLCEAIGSFHSKALTVPTFETRISIKNSVSILLQVQKRKNIKRKNIKTFKTNTLEILKKIDETIFHGSRHVNHSKMSLLFELFKN